MTLVYIRVWEYEVAAAQIGAFLTAYGIEGDWAKLFRQSPDYLGSELYRGTENASHFVTVDRWTSHSAWRSFRREWGDTYGRLDGRLESLIASQRQLIEGPA